MCPIPLIYSPVSAMDYDALTQVILSFATCARRTCTNVTIVDDLVDEPNESFFVTLERTLGLDNRITLNPVDGEIEIEDNDGIYIPLQKYYYCHHLISLPPSQYLLLLAMSSQYTLQLRLRGQYSSVPSSLILHLERHDLLTSLPPLKMALQVCMG